MKIRMGVLSSLVFVGSIAGYPLVAGVASIFDLPSTPLSITMRATVLFVSIVILVTAIVRSDGGSAIRMPVVFLMVVFVLYGLRLFHETFLLEGELLFPAYTYWVWFLLVSAIPMVSIIASGSPEFETAYRLLFYSLMASCLVVAFLSSDAIEAADRMALASLNPITVGHLGASLCILSLWALLRKPSGLPMGRGLACTGCALGLFILAGSASRGPAIALLGALFALLLSQKLSMRKFVAVLGGSAVVMGLVLPVIEATNFGLMSRFFGMFDGQGTSVPLRTAIYSFGVGSVLENPLLGSGVEIAELEQHPHNVILEAYMATGVVGGTILVGVLLWAVFKGLKHICRTRKDGWVILILLQYLVGSLLSGAFYAHSNLWVALAATLTLLLPRDGKPVRQSEHPISLTSPRAGGALS